MLNTDNFLFFFLVLSIRIRAFAFLGFKFHRLIFDTDIGITYHVSSFFHNYNEMQKKKEKKL